MLHDIMSKVDYLDVMELLEGKVMRNAARVSIRDGVLSRCLDYVAEWKLQFGILPCVPQRTNIFGADCDLDRHEDEYEVYLAKDVYSVRYAIDAAEEHDDVAMGQIFGYPSCCINAFREMTLGVNRDKGFPEYPYLNNALITSRDVPQQDHFAKVMTPILENRVLSFFPCSFDCGTAVAYARTRAYHMKTHYDWDPQPTTLNFSGWKIHFDGT